MNFRIMYLPSDESKDNKPYYFIEVEPDAFLGINQEPKSVAKAKEFIKWVHDNEIKSGKKHLRLNRRFLDLQGAYVIAGN